MGQMWDRGTDLASFRMFQVQVSRFIYFFLPRVPVEHRVGLLEPSRRVPPVANQQVVAPPRLDGDARFTENKTDTSPADPCSAEPRAPATSCLIVTGLSSRLDRGRSVRGPKKTRRLKKKTKILTVRWNENKQSLLRSSGWDCSYENFRV